MLRNERQVRGKNIRLTGPSLRDLGFDPKQPPPRPDRKSIRTDIVDLAPGLKFTVTDNAVGFVQFLVPANDDGV